MFKPNTRAEVRDWITPEQVEVVKMTPPVGQFERIMQKVALLREQMGPRYLCSEKNRVQRLDGKSYAPRPRAANVRSIKRKAAAA
ncbi:MAG: hypothetical protein M3496_03230 [Pseudomonadota bacterium]|jgi:hypothetical protein|nr:hypothetical protein [Pseudomonadota bacterium]